MAPADQDTMARLALDLLDAVHGRAPAPDASHPAFALPLERARPAGLVTGLTAAIGTWAHQVDAPLPAAWEPWVTEQGQEVAARQRRFDEITWRVLTALADADVPAVPLKGVVLARGPWPGGEARPMADIDLVVPADRREHAASALEHAGFPHLDRNPWEDTFLAWSGTEPLRRDGESAGHPGKVELHPGWVERLHNYLVSDGDRVIGRHAPGELADAPCRRLDDAAFAVQVLGHLSAAVVRAEVRALNVVDVLVAWRSLDTAGRATFAELCAQLDPRLVGPGLWLVDAYRPGAFDGLDIGALIDRLPAAAAAQLRNAPPASVLRDGTRRTSWTWRHAFTASLPERARMTRQFVWPSGDDLRGNADGRSAARLTADRVGRVARRLVTR